MKELDDITSNVNRLIERYHALEKENESLRQTAEQQRVEMMRTHSELVDLQQRYRQLHIAHAVSASAEDRDRAKAQITAIIQRVERVIDILKQ